jgi:hypothetical protein
MKNTLSTLLFLCAGLSSAFANNPDGALRVEVTTAYNFIVDSNVETPATYAPRAAYLTARIWNDGPTDLHNVSAYVGNGTTPGVYPNTTVLVSEGRGYEGTFSLVHEGGSLGTSDAIRFLGTIPAGEYKPVYWLVSYPILDASGKSVTGGSKPADDLVLTVNVSFQQGAPFTSLAGAAVEAVASRNSATVSGAVTVSPSSVLVVFPDGSLAPGDWQLQVRATVGTITQTIALATISVRASN